MSEFEDLLISERRRRPADLPEATWRTIRARTTTDPPKTRSCGSTGSPPSGIAISTVLGGNVVNMGDVLYEKDGFGGFCPQIPHGMDIGIIALQSTEP